MADLDNNRNLHYSLRHELLRDYFPLSKMEQAHIDESTNEIIETLAEFDFYNEGNKTSKQRTKKVANTTLEKCLAKVKELKT